MFLAILTDEMIRALAKTGGVVNVIFYPEHLEPGWSEKKKKVDAEIARWCNVASEAEQGALPCTRRSRAIACVSRSMRNDCLR